MHRKYGRLTDRYSKAFGKQWEFIEKHTTYPYSLIQNNVDRLGVGANSWVRPSDRTMRIRNWLEAHQV